MNGSYYGDGQYGQSGYNQSTYQYDHGAGTGQGYEHNGYNNLQDGGTASAYPGAKGVGGTGGANFGQGFKVSPDMINFGLSAGQDILSKQKEKWMPGMAGLWYSLKFYFAVNNNYVVKKLQTIVYPINHKSWNRLSAEDYSKGDNDHRKWALPRQDSNAPDLYIPVMAFVTYVLLTGLNTGIRGGKLFTPEILVQAVWRCLLLQLIETGIIKLGVNFLSVPLPFLDIFAYTGYKYVGLCLCVVARILGSFISTVMCIYTAAMLAFFVLKTFAAVVPSNAAMSGGPPRHIILLIFAVMQSAVLFILSMMN